MIAVPENTVLNLKGKVYDAALDEQKWPSFREAFANAGGSDSSILRSVNYEKAKAGFTARVISVRQNRRERAGEIADVAGDGHAAHCRDESNFGEGNERS